MLRVTVRSEARGRILGFDLESRPIAFWTPDRPAAEITAFAWKWTDEREPHYLLQMHTGRWVREDGRTMSDERAHMLFRSELVSAGLVFGHNIRRFDIGLFNAGLLRREMPPLPELLTTDTLRDYPKRRDMSASLENLVKIHCPDVGDKLHMSTVDWERANKLLPAGIAKARERVVSDVLLQERLRDRLLELGILGPAKWWRP